MIFKLITQILHVILLVTLILLPTLALAFLTNTIAFQVRTSTTYVTRSTELLFQNFILLYNLLRYSASEMIDSDLVSIESLLNSKLIVVCNSVFF